MTLDFAEGLKMSPQQATFESFLEALKWRIVRREKDRVIIERVNTGEQAEVKAKENEG
jgi:hypothetical protein